MTFLRTNYSFTTDDIIHKFDDGLQFIADRVAAKTIGSRLKAIEKIIQRLPREINTYNSTNVQKELEKVIYQLRTSDLVKGNATLNTELDTVEHIITTGIVYAPSKVEKVATATFGWFAYLKSFVKKPPPMTQQEIAQLANLKVAHVGAAALRLRHNLAHLTADQKASLDWQPKSGWDVTHMTTVAKHEAKVVIFNVATIFLISAVAFGVLGIFSLKTAVLGTLFWYSIRTLADRSMAVSNYEARTVPLVVRIPFVPFLAPITSIQIPTIKGAKQLVERIAVYGHNAFMSKGANGTMENLEPMNLQDLKTKAGWRALWNNVVKLSPGNHEHDWKPNFLTLGGVVILKNNLVPYNKMYAMLREGR